MVHIMDGYFAGIGIVLSGRSGIYLWKVLSGKRIIRVHKSAKSLDNSIDFASV